MTTPPDYAKIIDAETWTFIRETESGYPPETATFSIARQRAVYDAMCRVFHRGYPAGIAARNDTLGGVGVRIYEVGAAAATVVYFHGGGFVVGGLDSHDDVCADICAATGYRVISADYRLAPEHRHPAHFDDAMAATRAVAKTFGGPLVLAGDSVGATLAAAVAHATRGAGLGIIGQMLIYPGLGGDRRSGSYVIHAHAPMLNAADVEFYAGTRFGGGIEPASDPTAAPLHDSDFAGLPPTLIHAAECDPLCDDGAAYAAAITKAGGRARNTIEPGMVHGYLRARSLVARARDSFARITAGISALGQGRWPDSAA